MPKFFATLYAINASPEKPIWELGDMYGPFADEPQIQSFLNDVDPLGRTIKNGIVLEGKMFSREGGKLAPERTMLTVNQ